MRGIGGLSPALVTEDALTLSASVKLIRAGRRLEPNRSRRSPISRLHLSTESPPPGHHALPGFRSRACAVCGHPPGTPVYPARRVSMASAQSVANCVSWGLEDLSRACLVRWAALYAEAGSLVAARHAIQKAGRGFPPPGLRSFRIAPKRAWCQAPSCCARFCPHEGPRHQDWTF